MAWLWRGGRGPENIPDRVFPYLVINLKASADTLSQLRCVQQVSYVEGIPVDLIRIFDPIEAKKIGRIKDFSSLDQHPELIVYEGYVEKGSGRIHLESGLATPGIVSEKGSAPDH